MYFYNEQTFDLVVMGSFLFTGIFIIFTVNILIYFSKLKNKQWDILSLNNKEKWNKVWGDFIIFLLTYHITFIN